MNWLDIFLAWLIRLPRTARLAALARKYLAIVLRDLSRPCPPHPAADRALREACALLLFFSHTLVAAYIFSRAREIAGLPFIQPAWDCEARPRRLPTREALAKRAAELLGRLNRAEVHARKLATKLTTCEMEDILGALSSASPAEAGAEPHSGLVQGTQLSFLEDTSERFARIACGAGPRPPPWARWVGLAIRDAVALQEHPCYPPNHSHLTLCRTAA